MIMDIRGLINLVVLIFYMGCYNFYFYELLYGKWNLALAKGFYYFVTAAMLLYLFVGDVTGKRRDMHRQLSYISKLLVIVNFILFGLIYFAVIQNTKYQIIYIFLLNGSIFVLSIMVLFTGLKHEVFKD
jgi:hypothetical protein